MSKSLSGLPLVTIGIPVFNGEEYLSRALGSVINQTYQNLEIIISNNLSTDSTQSIVSWFARKDDRIKTYSQCENIGPIKNFQFTLEKSNGKYFMWLSHDDFLDQFFIERALNEFENGVVMVTSEIAGINENGGLISAPLKYKFDGGKLLRLVSYFLIEESHGKANLIYSLFHSEIAKKYIFTAPKNNYGFDMQFVFYLLSCGKLKQLTYLGFFKYVPSNRPINSNKVSSLLLDFFQYVFYLFGYLRLIDKKSIKVLIIILIPIKTLLHVYFFFKNRMRAIS